MEKNGYISRKNAEGYADPTAYAALRNIVRGGVRRKKHRRGGGRYEKTAYTHSEAQRRGQRDGSPQASGNREQSES